MRRAKLRKIAATFDFSAGDVVDVLNSSSVSWRGTICISADAFVVMREIPWHFTLFVACHLKIDLNIAWPRTR